MSQEQQEVQPVNEVYPENPNGIIQPLQQHSSSHSNYNNNGSFGPVFIVLGIIVALTVIATVLGRICSRQRRRNVTSYNKAEHSHGCGKNNKKAAGGGRSGDNNKFQRGGSDGDIEFGFDKKIATSKVADMRGGSGHHHPHQYGRQPRGSYNNGSNNNNNKGVPVPAPVGVPGWQNNNNAGGGGGENKGHVRFADDHIEFRAGH